MIFRSQKEQSFPFVTGLICMLPTSPQFLKFRNTKAQISQTGTRRYTITYTGGCVFSGNNCSRRQPWDFFDNFFYTLFTFGYFLQVLDLQESKYDWVVIRLSTRGLLRVLATSLPLFISFFVSFGNNIIYCYLSFFVCDSAWHAHRHRCSRMRIIAVDIYITLNLCKGIAVSQRFIAILIIAGGLSFKCQLQSIAILSMFIATAYGKNNCK